MQHHDPLNLGTSEGDILTDRTKKINNLTEVLQKQKQKVKELLQNQKHRNSKHHKNYNEPQNQEPISHQQGTEVYQRICTQVIDIGNRVLSGKRQNKMNQTAVEEKDIVRQEKQQEDDKEMDYLKSEQYRMYLESITKQNGSTSNQLVAKMKQTRNHNAYLNPSPRQISPRPSISPRVNPSDSLPPQPYRGLAHHRQQYRRQELYPVPIRAQALMLEENSLRRSLQLQLIGLQSGRRKTMVHTPTMKDIHNDLPLDKTIVHRIKQMKLQSKTVEFKFKQSVAPRASEEIRWRQPDLKLQKNQDQVSSKVGFNVLKTWDLSAFSESQPDNNKHNKFKGVFNIKVDYTKSNRIIKKYMQKKDKNQRRSAYSPAPAQTNHSKHNQPYRISASSKSHSSRKTSPEKTGLQKSAYTIDFKLRYPNSHKKTPQKVQPYCQKKSYLRKQNYTNYHQLQFEPFTQKKALDSQTTSTVTQSDCPPSYTPSKANKLTVVTPSRPKHRLLKH